jgi:agmatine deiminase
MDQAKQAYVEVAHAINQFEPVKMTCHPEDAEEAQMMCGPKIEIISLPIDDSWTRDSGPTFVIDRKGRIAGIDWEFNQWGADYPDCEDDADFARALLNHSDIEHFKATFVLEGGSIHVDGDGTLITTEQCLLHPNRNPELDQEEIEQLLREYLNVHSILWLGEGLMDDETDGHVDNLACFIKPGAVMALICNDPEDENYEVLQDNLLRLKHAKDARERNLEIVTVEQPKARWKEDERLAQSYINFYLPNQGIVIPAFNDPQRDESARATFEKIFPSRKIIQLDAQEIVMGGGGIHCITQQQPKVASMG